MDVGFRASALEITNEILALIAEIDEFKGSWRAIGRIAPEQLSRLRHVATIESIGSSTRIEGAKLTDREVEVLLAKLETRAFATRDEQEVAGYAQLMENVFADWKAIEFTENHIKQLHRDLLEYSTKDERHRGDYKTLPNHVEAFHADGTSAGIVFETASPFDTPRRMTELVAWTRSSLDQGKVHPLLIVAIFVVVFLEIHPFGDGNGRLSRVLTPLLLLRSGYSYVSYASLESVIEQNKQAYYLALRQTQGTIRSDTPNWQPWVTYFLQALQTQKDHLAKKIERERVMLGDLPALSVQILAIAEATGASRNSIKDHIVALTRSGSLERHGAGRGTWYSLA